jgi:hypothetical protein
VRGSPPLREPVERRDRCHRVMVAIAEAQLPTPMTLIRPPRNHLYAEHAQELVE